jgi:hypothetical protein
LPEEAAKPLDRLSGAETFKPLHKFESVTLPSALAEALSYFFAFAIDRDCEARVSVSMSRVRA